MYVGQNISIQFGGAVGFGAVVSGMVHCTVSAETEKAVQFRADNGQTAWFPRKALVPHAADAGLLKLARWFRPTGQTARFIENNRTFGGQSVL